jgi:hypothetical protein
MIIYYTKKPKNVENEFVVIIWNYYHFKKNITQNLQGIYTLPKIHIYFKIVKKWMLCIGTHISIFITNCKRFCSKTHSYEKVVFV